MLNRAALALSFIISIAFAQTAFSQPAEPKIGLLIPLTGAYQQIGTECRWGYELVEMLRQNGRTVLADSQSDGKTSTVEFKRLAEIEHVDSVVTLRSPVGMAVNPLSKQYRIPVSGLVANPRFVIENPYAVQYWPDMNDEGLLMANAALAQGRKTAAIFATEDEWLLPFAEAFRKAFESQGGKIVFNEQFAPTEVEALASLLARARRSDPGVLMFFTSIQQIPTLIRRSREMAMNQPIMTLWWAQNAESIEAAGAHHMHDVFFTEVDYSVPEFVSAFTAKHAVRPNPASFLCYLQARAIEKVFPGPAAEFRDRLLALSSIKLESREFPIDGRRVKLPVKLLRVEVAKPESAPAR